MDNKEIKEMIKGMKEVLELLEKSGGKVGFVKNEINKAFNEPAKISIEKDANGKAKTSIEGSTLAILITLAGLEKCVLEKLDTPNDIWELIKNIVGTKQADEEVL